MRTLLLTLLLAGSVLAAEPHAVAKIRARYQAQLDAAKDGPDNRHTLISRHVVPGIGAQTKTVDFFYSETDDGEDPKTGEPRRRRTLERVVFAWNVAARPMKRELLFLDGALAFAHEVETSGTCEGVETRLYFEKGVLVRVRASPEEGCAAPAAANRDASFTGADRDRARRVQAEATAQLDWWKRLEAL